MKPILLLFQIACFLLLSCKQHETAYATFSPKFYTNQGKFNELILALKQDTFLEKKYGEVFKASRFNNKIQQRLKELKIDEVHMFSWGRNQKQFDFKTSWRQQVPIHLYYNTLDSITTKVGYYEKDRNSNEIWGLGNHWSLWTEVKLIDAKQ